MTHFNHSVWESTIYSQNLHLNKYPFDNVVSFIYNNLPKNKERGEISILEIGCGAGNNLWFAAREGFKVTGIDGSNSAIGFAKERFFGEGLNGSFVVGDFTDLPFANEEFDIIIDRASIVCVDKFLAKKTLAEILRVLNSHGKFFFNVYSDRHSSCFSGRLESDGSTADISKGSLVGVGNISFYGWNELVALLGNKWNIMSIKHKTVDEIIEATLMVHAEWELVIQKKD